MIALERAIERKILPFVCRFLLLLKKRNDEKLRPKKILVVRLWALGESLLTLPAIKKLKENFSDAKITVLTRKEYGGIFKQRFIDEIIFFHPLIFIEKYKHYDIGIDFEPHFNVSAILTFFLSKQSIGFSHGFRGKLYDFGVDYNHNIHVIENFMNLLKPLEIDKGDEIQLVGLPYSKEDKENIDKKLKKCAGKKIIGIHVGSGGTIQWRVWPIENYIELIKQLTKKGIYVVLTGSKKERKLNEEIIKKLNNKMVLNLAGTTMGELAYLMKKFEVFVSGDTGPMHVAAAQGTKVIGLFGPTSPRDSGPYPLDKNIIIYHRTECSPCKKITEPYSIKCPYNGKCIKSIKVEEVFKEIESLGFWDKSRN